VWEGLKAVPEKRPAKSEAVIPAGNAGMTSICAVPEITRLRDGQDRRLLAHGGIRLLELGKFATKYRIRMRPMPFSNAHFSDYILK